ncbi:DUF3566 domain-containing protein [Trueperella pecoris]|nr:DUF3566 domain-containing protein [Trueperella pecoris]
MTETTQHIDTGRAAETDVQAPSHKDVGIRRVRMTISRVDPLSALKLSFLVSVGVGIMIVVAAIILWFTLDAMYVWARIEELLVTLNSAPLLELGQFMQFGRVVSFAVVVGVIEVVLMTAFGTILALLYNVVAMLVGGLYITVTDE